MSLHIMKLMFNYSMLKFTADQILESQFITKLLIFTGFRRRLPIANTDH